MLHTKMKYSRSLSLLLLLLTVSCVSNQQVVRHRGSHQADAFLQVPSTRAAGTPNVPERPLAEPELASLPNQPVSSAKPLVSQVHRANPGTWQAQKQQALDSLCSSPLFETTQLGLYVYDLTDGQPLYAVNAAHRMRPASCQKVVTAVTALQYLGGDYRLHTDFRITGTVRGHVLEGNLCVVGGMDPLVTPDELLQAAATIRQRTGIDSIAGTIIYDLTMREETPLGWGWCWDDDYGPLSALLVDGRDAFSQNWIQALAAAGIRLRDAVGQCAMTDRQARPICTIRHSIDDLLGPMMKESNNIFAECLFYQIAATTGKKGAGHKQVAQRTEELLSRLGLDPTPYQVADGSGLSLYNYVSAEMLVALLGYAWRTPSIREHLLPSLPVAGIDGTLEKRMQDTVAQGNVRGKTGTVTGISSLAGYLTAANNHTLAFAIINQGISSSAIGRTFQDKVCLELCK